MMSMCPLEKLRWLVGRPSLLQFYEGSFYTPYIIYYILNAECPLQPTEKLKKGEVPPEISLLHIRMFTFLLKFHNHL